MTVFHLAIGFKDKPVEASTVQDTFPSAAGWARYAPNCWIISTSATATTIAEGVRKVCKDTDNIFIAAVNLQDRDGYLQQEIWDWIKKNQ